MHLCGYTALSYRNSYANEFQRCATEARRKREYIRNLCNQVVPTAALVSITWPSDGRMHHPPPPSPHLHVKMWITTGEVRDYAAVEMIRDLLKRSRSDEPITRKGVYTIIWWPISNEDEVCCRRGMSVSWAAPAGHRRSRSVLARHSISIKQRSSSSSSLLI